MRERRWTSALDQAERHPRVPFSDPCTFWGKDPARGPIRGNTFSEVLWGCFETRHTRAQSQDTLKKSRPIPAEYYGAL